MERMQMRRYALSLAAALLATAAVPSVAAAANAVVTVDLNMRAGPSTAFPVVDVIPDNAEVTVHGCVGGYQWCDATWRGARGWIYGDYLSYYYGNRYVPLVEYGPRAGLPIIAFSVGSYWDNYYRDRPWYGQRTRWQNVWRGDRRDIREDRREARREDRADRRDDRRDARTDRRRENRVERRQDRRETTIERREQRRDASADRRREQRSDGRAEQRRDNRAESPQERRGDAGAARERERGPGPSRNEQRGRGREG